MADKMIIQCKNCQASYHLGGCNYICPICNAQHIGPKVLRERPWRPPPAPEDNHAEVFKQLQGIRESIDLFCMNDIEFLRTYVDTLDEAYRSMSHTFEYYKKNHDALLTANRKYEQMLEKEVQELRKQVNELTKELEECKDQTTTMQ